jgi:S-formylglutathione hydrolase FrmB
LVTERSKGIQLLGDLEAAGAITATSLSLPLDLPFDQYESLMAMFGQLHRTSAWLIGDGLNFGERVYGETYAQAAEATGLTKGALMNYASVCAHIPRSRRRATVAFSTHMEVAYLEPDEQKYWLDQAAANHWTKEELRAARKAADPTPALEVEICPTCKRPFP